MLLKHHFVKTIQNCDFFQPSKDHSRGIKLIHFISKVIRLHLFDIVILGQGYEQDTAKFLAPFRLS